MASRNRRYHRDISFLIIRYSLPTTNPANDVTAMMADYSGSGLRIVTRHPLEEGQEVVINGGFFGGALPAATDTDELFLIIR